MTMRLESYATKVDRLVEEAAERAKNGSLGDARRKLDLARQMASIGVERLEREIDRLRAHAAHADSGLAKLDADIARHKAAVAEIAAREFARKTAA